ncbi:MAG: hypothetical protein U0359_22760 [Byssovorax sp.]
MRRDLPLLVATSAALSWSLLTSGCGQPAEPKVSAPAASPPASASSPSAAPSVALSAAPSGPAARPGWRGALAFEPTPLAGVPDGKVLRSVFFVDDTTLLVRADDEAVLCDMASWRCALPLPSGLTDWTASADGRWLAANDKDATVLFDAKTGKEARRLVPRKEAQGDTLALSVTGDQLLVTTSPDIDKLHFEVWSTDAASTAPLRKIDLKQIVPWFDATLTPASEVAAFVERNGHNLMVEKRKEQRTPFLPPERFVFSPDRTAAIIAGVTMERGAGIQIYRLPEGTEGTHFDAGSFPIDPSSGDHAYTREITTSRGGARVAITIAAKNQPMSVVVFDGQDGHVIARLDKMPGTIESDLKPLLSPDGKDLLWVRPRPPGATGAGPQAGESSYEIVRASLP